MRSVIILLSLVCFGLLGCHEAEPAETVVGQSATEPENIVPAPSLADLGEGETVTLMHVTDGDTIIVDRNGNPERVRLIGIDTPETAGSPRGEEPFANEATQALRLLLRETEINLRLDVDERDRFGRILAYVESADGTFVNREMIRRGWARPVTVPPNVVFADDFARLAEEAREARRGIWQAP